MTIKIACFDCGFEWDWSTDEPVPVCPKCGSDDLIDLETDDLTKKASKIAQLR